METSEAIFLRRSIRKYKEKPVEWDKICSLIYAGMHAPSAGNIQNWKFIIVTDEGSRQKISENCYGQLWMVQAPVYIVVCSEPEKTEQFYGIRGQRLYSIQNAAAVVENILLAATDMGLGSCWVGAFDEETVADTLGIPESARPQAIITIGYADEDPYPPTRHDIYTVAFLNGYGGRIKNINHVLGYHSEKVHRAANAIKNAGQKSGKHIGNHLRALNEKGKEILRQYRRR